MIRIAMIFAIFAAPAFAQQTCAPRQAVLDQLAGRFGETRQSMGIAANGFVVELFATPPGSWTITATRPDGVTCLIASGEAFEAMAERLPPNG